MKNPARLFDFVASRRSRRRFEARKKLLLQASLINLSLQARREMVRREQNKRVIIALTALRLSLENKIDHATVVADARAREE